MRESHSHAQPPLILPSSLERRGWSRSACSWYARCRSVTHSHVTTVWRGRFEDISPSGLCVLLDRRFEKGTLLVIEPEVYYEHMLSILLAKVIRVTRRRDGAWRIGCRLTSPLDAEELNRSISMHERTLLVA